MDREEFESQSSEPNHLTIKFQNGEVEIPTAPLCAREEIHEAIDIVDEKFPQFAELLPEGHAWREPKALHSIQTQAVAIDILEDLGLKTDDPNFFLLLFIGEVHDLGRVIDGLKGKKMAVPEGFEDLKHHGQYSVKVLEDWAALEGFPPETQEIIKFAILHHAEKDTAKLPENASDKEKTEYVYNCLFRDMDKLSILMEKTDKYLYDTETRKKQFEVCQGIMDKNNKVLRERFEKGEVPQEEMEAGLKTFEGENGQVTPQGMSLFLDSKLNSVADFTTYETYMLNTLGFIFDINLPAVTQKVVDAGVVDKFLGYLQSRLPAEQFQAIDRKTREYLTGLNIELPQMADKA